MADSVSYCTAIDVRWRHALRLWVPGATAILAGGLIAAAIAHAPTPALVRLVAYLVVVVGVAQIALAAGQALLARPAAGMGVIRLESAFFNLGSAGVVGGTLGHNFLAVLLGTVAILGALAGFLFTVRHAPGGYTLRLHQALIGIIALGAAVGLLLSGLGSTP